MKNKLPLEGTQDMKIAGKKIRIADTMEDFIKNPEEIMIR